MKKRRIGKKGYFFLIDSILALSILAIGVFLIFSTYSDVPSKEGAEILSEDIMDFFANNKIKDTNSEYAGVGGVLWVAGNITNADNTLLQQIGEFYANSELVLAEKFIENLTGKIIPQQFLFEFRMENMLLYPRNPSQGHIDSKNSTRVLIPSRKIVHGFLNPETGDLFGPYSTEVLVWQNIN